MLHSKDKTLTEKVIKCQRRYKGHAIVVCRKEMSLLTRKIKEVFIEEVTPELGLEGYRGFLYVWLFALSEEERGQEMTIIGVRVGCRAVPDSGQ